MKTRDLVSAVASSTRQSRRRTEPLVRATLKQIREGLLRDGEVAIYGLGRLSIQTHGERKLKCLRTGEPIVVSSFKVVRFTPARNVARRVKKMR